uniref:Secreted protein n=1 Tax=Rhizophora mucronata TaxID=61149 RepID=A0A2P2NH45_RHIMU
MLVCKAALLISVVVLSHSRGWLLGNLCSKVCEIRDGPSCHVNYFSVINPFLLQCKRGYICVTALRYLFCECTLLFVGAF